MRDFRGIAGIGRAPEIVLEGLKRLEYRGYDSFGIAVPGNPVQVIKKQGRISEAGQSMASLQGTMAIGHTGWATHGVPSDVNAHPHTDCTGTIVVVHNGIIENYMELKRELMGRGHRFRSETDTEVIAHLLEEEYNGDLLRAVGVVLPGSRSYALLLCTGEPRIIAARQHSPYPWNQTGHDCRIGHDPIPNTPGGWSCSRMAMSVSLLII